MQVWVKASQSYRSHLGHFDAVILGTPISDGRINRPILGSLPELYQSTVFEVQLKLEISWLIGFYTNCILIMQTKDVR